MAGAHPLLQQWEVLKRPFLRFDAIQLVFSIYPVLTCHNVTTYNICLLLKASQMLCCSGSYNILYPNPWVLSTYTQQILWSFVMEDDSPRM